MSPAPLRIATRASQLALWQSNYIADLLRQADPGREVVLVEISTTGDRVQTETLRALGSFGVFTREVQAAILDGRADLAVHSLKDLPTDVIEGLSLGAVPPRAPEHDALILPQSSSLAPTLDALPQGARVGTGSPRRQAQLKMLRPDLALSEVRGNVDTRLKKLDAGDYEALILAAAGLTRLGWSRRISAVLQPPVMYPAVGQGAIGVECRTEDLELRKLLERLTDCATLARVLAERNLMSTLRAGCHAPLGVSTRIEGDRLFLEAVVLPLDGSDRWTAAASGLVSAPEDLGVTVAQLLIAQGVERVLGRTE